MLQPDPAELTNVLLLRILRQDASFGGVDPLAPISNVPTGVLRAQSILFASLSVTLLVSFIAVLGKRWILYYTRAMTRGNIIDRGKEHQAKLAGLRKWRLHLIMELPPLMLQFALLLFGVALVVYLWDLDVSIAGVVLAVTSIGLAFYTCIATIATVYSDCPFKSPLSVLLPKVLPWAKEFTAFARVWLGLKATPLLSQIERVTGHCLLGRVTKRTFGIQTGETNTPTYSNEGVDDDHPVMFSNPAFWRDEPLFTSPIPQDIGASAGFWLLENSTDSSAASAVAAVFPEFQWPSHFPSTTALIRLRDTYVECFREPGVEKSTRLKALQSAAAYYVLRHTQLIWSTSNRFGVEAGRFPPDLPPDLFLHPSTDEWKGEDVFEYLLHIKVEDRSEPVTSARFLSYIAPYWFCGDSDSAMESRPSRLQTLYELIKVLEESRLLNPVTLTDCVLCAGAAVDFPLHPEDLIRVDKRCVPPPHAGSE